MNKGRGSGPKPTRLIIRRQAAVATLRGLGFMEKAIADKLGVPLSTVVKDIRLIKKYGAAQDADIAGIQRQLTSRLLGVADEARHDREQYVKQCKRGISKITYGQPSFDFINVVKGLLGEEGAKALITNTGLMEVKRIEETLIPNPSRLASLYDVETNAIKIALEAYGSIRPEGQRGEGDMYFTQNNLCVFPGKLKIEDFESAVAAFKRGDAVAVLPEVLNADRAKDPTKK